jgi:low affinity Fe/Cu permease
MQSSEALRDALVRSGNANNNGASHLFSQLASRTAHLAGKPLTFLLAVAVVLGWAISGPVFGFSDTWQLVINTGTTIVTFLMVFLIQSTQNRDTEAMQVKLDELIRVMKNAQTALLDLEELEDDELDRIYAEYRALAQEARDRLRSARREPRGATEAGKGSKR